MKVSDDSFDCLSQSSLKKTKYQLDSLFPLPFTEFNLKPVRSAIPVKTSVESHIWVSEKQLRLEYPKKHSIQFQKKYSVSSFD